jgi:hypothetical protein
MQTEQVVGTPPYLLTTPKEDSVRLGSDCAITEPPYRQGQTLCLDQGVSAGPVRSPGGYTPWRSGLALRQLAPAGMGFGVVESGDSQMTH